MAEMTTQQAVDILTAQFPLVWSQIGEKPIFITVSELQNMLKSASQLTSPDGSVWEMAIDNDGKVAWGKIEEVENDGGTIGN